MEGKARNSFYHAQAKQTRCARHTGDPTPTQRDMQPFTRFNRQPNRFSQA